MSTPRSTGTNEESDLTLELNQLLHEQNQQQRDRQHRQQRRQQRLLALQQHIPEAQPVSSLPRAVAISEAQHNFLVHNMGDDISDLPDSDYEYIEDSESYERNEGCAIM